jgi:undecaprenyl-diphosphatase
MYRYENPGHHHQAAPLMNTVLSGLTRIDTAFFLWLSGLRSGGYPWLSRQISRSGDGPLYAVAGILILLLDDSEGVTVVCAMLLAFGIELPTYLFLKNSVRRRRPPAAIEGARAWLEPSDEFSFPSGHTAAAFLMAVILSSAYPILYPWLFLWAALVGVSRVTLGVHFPGDIVAGALLGCSSAIIATGLLS